MQVFRRKFFLLFREKLLVLLLLLLMVSDLNFCFYLHAKSTVVIVLINFEIIRMYISEIV